MKYLFGYKLEKVILKQLEGLFGSLSKLPLQRANNILEIINLNNGVGQVALEILRRRGGLN